MNTPWYSLTEEETGTLNEALGVVRALSERAAFTSWWYSTTPTQAHEMGIVVEASRHAESDILRILEVFA